MFSGCIFVFSANFFEKPRFRVVILFQLKTRLKTHLCVLGALKISDIICQFLFGNSSNLATGVQYV